MPRATVLSVSEYIEAVNLTLEESAAIVMGEVAELRARGAWVSFSLKDEHGGAVLKCVLASWKYQSIGVALEDGMTVKAAGVSRITKHYGTFGFWVEALEPTGEGSLRRAYELLKKKLEAEGLFARKRPLPEFISRVGVITSKNGVVIHDFEKNLRPLGIRVRVYDSPVEGIGAVDALSWALRYWQGHAGEIDALAVIRGGGGLESMQAFNNESVCRELFAVPAPVICGIGHEVDAPLASLVADLSVSTPTAAAHAVNATWNRAFESASRFDPARAFERLLRAWKERVAQAEKLLRFADPLRNLRLGYALVQDERGKILKDARALAVGARVKTRLGRGSFFSDVKIIEKRERSA